VEGHHHIVLRQANIGLHDVHAEEERRAQPGKGVLGREVVPHPVGDHEACVAIEVPMAVGRMRPNRRLERPRKAGRRR